MTAFDTDVLTVLLAGKPDVLARLMLVPPDERTVPIVAAEEMARGRLSAIRMAASGRGRSTLERTYDLFRRDLIGLRDYGLLPYDGPADALFQTWRQR